MDRTILIIYTGGTIGSVQTVAGGLAPLDFSEIHRHVPELVQDHLTIETVSFESPIDSSDMGVEHWGTLAGMIQSRYDEFDGFVILHGTDTLAYTASALSFMLEGLHKPIILTGSQLPIGLPRTDGRENLLSAVEIACAQRLNKPVIQEVAVYFGSSLYRGNRTHKASAESMRAIISPNLPPLAEAGVDIQFNDGILFRDPLMRLNIHEVMESRIAWMPLFPAQSSEIIKRILDWPDIKGLVLSTFGSGNAPTNAELKALLSEADTRGVSVVNVSQCSHGAVHPERYATAHMLRDCGVIPGGDMTTEAALTKFMHCLGLGLKGDDLRNAMRSNLRGEITKFSPIMPGH
ncbi:MAG TPA: L-asparaginase 1 [Flavobacteriales bacterium]|nr:L-asparaginase 1 [Flavobacteriales bacterium]|tara:strand:+ start:1927 stop:2970 length:1044 start_codon:yes stop_codon:yes gene_type:complete